MIQKTILILLSAFISISAIAQNIIIKGTVSNMDNKALPGVNIQVSSSGGGAFTGINGDYTLENISTGETVISFSLIGFETQNIQYKIKEGENILNVSLKETAYDLPSIVVNAQKREEEIRKVPLSINAVSQKQINELSIENMSQFADLVPGLNVRIQSMQRPNFVIRGLSSDEVSPNAQPRVSIFMNNAPVSRASGGVVELYDMERIEVLKGPQGTLFGRGAQIGAIHYITKMPTNELGGYLQAGYGSYNQYEMSFAANVPVIENKLNTRIAAFYNQNDSYIENYDGTKLGDKESKGFRFSTRFFPCSKGKVDLSINYQKDKGGGIGFMSGTTPTPNGPIDYFDRIAYLNNAEDLYIEKELLNANLNIHRQLSSNIFITAITSYQTNKSFERFDGDGSLLYALDMTEDINAKLFNQEIRLNYNIGKKFKGFSGVNYLYEEIEQDYIFRTNEQHLGYVLFQMTPYVQYNGDVPYPMTHIPDDPRLGPLAGMPIPFDEIHEENNLLGATNKAFEIFTDATYDFSEHWSVSAGLRLVMDKSEVNRKAALTGGQASFLGNITQNAPNFMFLPSEYKESEGSYTGITGRFVLNYQPSEKFNFFASYNRGRRPNVLQYDTKGEVNELKDETVDSYDLGMKARFGQVFQFDLTGFYYQYKHFQLFDATQPFLIIDSGNATSYGAETSFNLNIIKGLSAFGNYTYIIAKYNDKDDNGNEQDYAGNQFRLTPEHTINFSLKGAINLGKNFEVFAIPSVNYKSDYYFDDSNSEELKQDGFATFNVSAGVKELKRNITLSLYAHNLLDEDYLLSAGNMGSFYGAPTYIPAIGRTFGLRLRWDF